MGNSKQVFCRSLGFYKKINAKIKVSDTIARNTCFSWRCALVTEANDYARCREPRINVAQLVGVCRVWICRPCTHAHRGIPRHIAEAGGSIVLTGAQPDVPVRPL